MVSINVIKFEDISNSEWIFFTIFVSLILLVIIFILITIFLNSISHKDLKSNFNKKMIKSRSLIIDFNLQVVTEVTIKNDKKIVKYPLQSLLDFFVKEDGANFLNFTQKLLNSDINLSSSDACFLSYYCVNKKKNKKMYAYFTFICTFIDKKNKKIYLDASCLMNLPIKVVYEKIKKNRPPKKVFYNLTTLKTFFKNKIFYHGNAYLFSIYRKPNQNITYNSYLLRCNIINNIYRICPSNVCFSLNDDSDCNIIMLDTKLMNDFQLTRFVTSLSKQIEESLEISGLFSYYDYKIAYSHISDNKIDFVNLYNNLEGLINLVDNQNNHILSYKKQNTDYQTIENSYKTEVQKIIKAQSFDVLFRPVVKITAKRVNIYGYMTTYKIKESVFKTYQDFIDAADKYKLNKEAFSIAARKTIPTFITQKDGGYGKLFFFVDLKDINFVKTTFSHFNTLDSEDLILYFDNRQIAEQESDPSIQGKIKSFQSLGYQCVIKIKINDYFLKDSSYQLFDSFLFDLEGLGIVKQDSREFIKIHSLLERFVKFNKPIIVYNCASWQIIELLVQSGIYYFSGDVISAYSSMLLPLDKKVIKKLLNM